MITDVQKTIGQEYLNWNDKAPVLIEAGTGAGKTSFIKNDLYKHCKDNNKIILLISNRNNLLKQNKKILDTDNDFTTDDGTLFLINYQKLDSFFFKADGDLSKFDYIVCDEAHYFFSDSWNGRTHIGLDVILKSNAIKVFMSATIKLIKLYLQYTHKEAGVVHYEIKVDNTNFYKSVKYFRTYEPMRNLLDNMPTGDKAIWFTSAKNAYALHRDYKNRSIFSCSRYNNQYSQFLDNEKINRMIDNEFFEEDILFTTTVNDNGVNFNDPAIKHIIIDLMDIDEIIQCLGRRRKIRLSDGTVNPLDGINIYIMHRSLNSIKGRIGGIESVLKYENEFKELGMNEFALKYINDDKAKSIIVNTYDKKTGKSGIGLNVFRLANMKIESMICRTILDMSDFAKKHNASYDDKYNTYAIFMNNKLGYKGDCVVIETKNNIQELNDYLDNIVGKKLFKEEQKQLKEQFIKAGLKDKSMGFNTLNGKLLDLKLPYTIRSFNENYYKEDGKRNKRVYWAIITTEIC